MKKYLENLKENQKIGVIITLRLLFMTLFCLLSKSFIPTFILLVVLSLIVDGIIILFYYLRKRKYYTNLKTLILHSYIDRIFIATLLFIVFILLYLNTIHMNFKYS